jgi:hypothetical protein
LGRIGPKKGGERPIKDGQFLAPPGEVDVNRRSYVIGTAQIDDGQGGEKRQHPRRSSIETQAPQDPTEVQPVAGQDRAAVRH